ncbi:MAG: ferritin-like domain-containing protein, partial [Pseudomonadota bacterium]|nr:ferritin-like domain-containing protein [Pseudomonadota bacterium]
MENHNLEETEITADLVYQSVDPSDFNAMLEVDRYNDRTTAFDKIISATHNHFWDPMDTKYIDFSMPFDVENEYMINPDQDVDLRVIGDLLNEKDKIRLVNMNVHWSLSSIL